MVQPTSREKVGLEFLTNYYKGLGNELVEIFKGDPTQIQRRIHGFLKENDYNPVVVVGIMLETKGPDQNMDPLEMITGIICAMLEYDCRLSDGTSLLNLQKISHALRNGDLAHN